VFRIRNLRRNGLTALLFFLCSDVSVAHPGHGTVPAETGVLHYLTSPMHMAPALLLIVFIASALGFISRMFGQKPE
jgi:hypothetical protein